jgi:hypothetical protein
VPEWVRERAHATLISFDHDTPVADLVFDSLLDDPTSPVSDIRTLRFLSTRLYDVEATVRVVRCGGTVSAVIDVDPPRRYRVEVRHHDGPSLITTTDIMGQAHVSGIPRGLISIYLMPHGSDNDVRRTAWITV